jgi:hypothetical protein
MARLFIFNVFHVRALYYTKTLITNKCTKRVLSSIVTHSYIFRPCWVIFRKNFFVIVTLRLHFIVEWECAVFGGVNYLQSRSRPAGRDCREFTPTVHSTQSTAHSYSSIKCNLSVTIPIKFSLKMTQQGRNMYECATMDDKTLFVHLLVIRVFGMVIVLCSTLESG